MQPEVETRLYPFSPDSDRDELNKWIAALEAQGFRCASVESSKQHGEAFVCVMRRHAPLPGHSSPISAMVV